MIRLAFVDARFAEQVRTNPKELAGITVVYCGGTLADLEERGRALAPAVVVVGLEELGEVPLARAHQLLERTRAGLVVVVYTFARRDLVFSLAGHRAVRPVQGPLSLANLRCQMLPLIVGEILASSDTVAAAAPVECPRCGSPVNPPALTAGR